MASIRLVPHTLAAAVAAAVPTWAAAQSAGAPAADAPARITITGSRGQQPVSVAGFGDVPLAQLPLSATVITRSQLADAGISSLGDITRLDADITDAYNAPGYINQLAVRGFTLDNRFNYRRDGLPINAETVIAQGNKQALELLKGTSGLQAGTSAPGGLVNLVVKRPTGTVREFSLNWTQPGTLGLGVDVGQREASGFGWRINAEATKLAPATRASRGERGLFAAAVDFRGDADLVEAEIERSRQRQPSTPGFSLLGARLPDAASIDPRVNLNNQSWSLPVVFAGMTGSLRWTRTLDADTQISAHVMQQQLRTDDRIAFPYGCSNENRYDRYCSDGSFDLYDFRSENERRTTRAAQLGLSARRVWGGIEHRLGAGVLASQFKADFQRQAYNWVGVGTIDEQTALPADPSLTDENTNRRERSREFHLQDAITLTRDLMIWAGARHTQIERDSVRTDGGRATHYTQSFTTPWLAGSLRLADTPGQGSTLLYASWGQGIESEVAPNRSRYVNRGEALPALKSRQTEIGLKHRTRGWEARAALFDIVRPAWNDIHTRTGIVAQDDCSDADPCRRQADGTARHRGAEIEAEWRLGELSLRGSAMWLRARREGSVDAAANGLRPTNVPARSLKAQAAWSPAAWPEWALLAFMTHEGQRMVLPDNSIATPGWTRLDLGARWTGRWQTLPVTLRLGLDNATDRRAWQEAPFQYGHAYLYPLAPRTWHATAQLRF